MLGLAVGAACISKVDADPDTVLTNPNDPNETVPTTSTIAALCGTICDALIEGYGVPTNLRTACIFECANGFGKAPDACYELVACVADKTLCEANDISPGCLARAGDCLPHWSLANGSCRGCWQPSRTVHGTQIVTYLSEGTPSVDPRPEDFSGMLIAALLPRGQGNPYRFAGTGHSDGTYTIKSVPGCGAFIQVGTTYTWASNTDVDTSYNFPGRKNPAVAAPDTFYEIAIHNTTPWTQNDWLEGFVPQLGYFNGGFFGFVPPYDPNDLPSADGGTDLLLRPNWTGLELIDPAQKDLLYLVQLSSVPGPAGSIVRTAKRFARITDFAPKSGQVNPYDVTLMPVVENKSVRIEFKRTTFTQYASDLHPASVRAVAPGGNLGTTGLGAVDIWTHPGRPRVGATGELVLIDRESADGDIPAVDVKFGTPYDASFGIDLSAMVSWYVPLTDRNGGQFYGRELIAVAEPLDRHAPNSPVVARVSPPRNIRINGQRLDVVQAGATLTLTPTISWEVPALGEPERYEVNVHEMTNPRNFPIQGKTVATFVVPKLAGQSAPALHSVTLPPDILKRGIDYYFDVDAAVRKVDERDDDALVVTSEYRP